MSTSGTDPSVHASILVEGSLERAFEVFTAGLGTWFPSEYNLMSTPIVERVFEPRVGGRIYDRGEDGSECHWGNVLAYEPPHRVVFVWGLTPQWSVDLTPERSSEVEVRFTAETPERTRVELEHRHLDRHGEGWERSRASLTDEGGWQWCLQRFAERIAA